MLLENWIGSLFNYFGFELRRHPHRTNPEYQLLIGLKYHNIDHIFDVGANTGQFSSKIRKLGFEGNIISFEPLCSAYNALIKSTSKDNRWVAYPRCAIGDYDGDIVINVSENSVSSSILPMLDTHKEAEKKSNFVTSETVPIHKLDTVTSSYFENDINAFLKIDTQGYEWNVLNGALNIIPKLKGIHCELSLVLLYQGQHLWMELLERLENEGFILWNIQPGFTNIDSGRTLQIDAIFFRDI